MQGVLAHLFDFYSVLMELLLLLKEHYFGVSDNFINLRKKEIIWEVTH